MTKTIVFVGPTLGHAEARALLPDATIAPPVAFGDVLRLARARRRPQRIAIIDGYFERMAAVWHKEIVFALERGIEVWGAASMGALRAAELHTLGMIGVGQIYHAYRRGDLVADDEVAVAHLPAEQGYRVLSVALVDLREAIRKTPGLTGAVRNQLFGIAQARFYRERTWPALLADARAAGVPERHVRALERGPRPARKAADARMLLRRLARTPVRGPAPIATPRTWAFARLVEIVRARE